MALDPVASTAAYSTPPYDRTVPTATIRTRFSTNFVTNYVTHSLGGVCTTMTVTGAGEAALQAELDSWMISEWLNVHKFAVALAAYWATETTPKAPFVSVTNNAGTKVAAFEAALTTFLQVPTSISGNMVNFFTRTDTVVKGIAYDGLRPDMITHVIATVN